LYMFKIKLATGKLFKMTSLNENWDDLAVLFGGISSECDDSSVSTDTSSKSSASGRKRLYNSDELKEKNKEWCKDSRRRRKLLVQEVVTFCKDELQTLAKGFLNLQQEGNQSNTIAYLAGRVKNLQTVFDEMQFH
jgi:hypothetical protein